MFDIGIWEILLILVLALLVIGPERLPGAARTAGLWVGRARRYVEGVKSEVEQEFDVSEFKRIVHNQEIQLNELQQKLNLANPLEDDKESSSEENIHEIMDEIMNEGRVDEDPIPTNEDKKIDDEKD
jgi:sec-independent protein translocase protein TatB